MSLTFNMHLFRNGARGNVCHKTESRGFETHWCEQFFKFTQFFQYALVPGDYSAFNKNVYQKQKNNVPGE
jgi:hypothetical protein